MPTYQYACTECGHRFEAVQSFSDPTLTDCPACTGRLRKVFNSVGIVFKGSGFYRTDSRSDAKGSATVSANGAAGKPAKSDAAKSDSGSSSANGSAASGSTSSSSASSSSGGGSSSSTTGSGSASSASAA